MWEFTHRTASQPLPPSAHNILHVAATTQPDGHSRLRSGEDNAAEISALKQMQESWTPEPPCYPNSPEPFL